MAAGKPWKVVSYASCWCCPSWSLGVRADGRFVRHSPSFGSVERSRAVRLGVFRTTVCKGSLTRPKGGW